MMFSQKSDLNLNLSIKSINFCIFCMSFFFRMSTLKSYKMMIEQFIGKC